ncbi:MAG TPA: hypothetical protein VGL41_01200 [Roseiarcus sp.]|jgi:hypothetical protein
MEITPQKSAADAAAVLPPRAPSPEARDAPTMKAAARDPASTSPLRRILVIYAILGLVWFAFPGGLVDWLDEHNSTGWLAAPLALARGIDAASAATGVKQVGQSLRKRFAAIIGDDEG